MKYIILFTSLLSISDVLGQSLLTTASKDCNYKLPWTCDECELTWTGNCVDSLPNGNGVLTVSYDSETIMQYDGSMKDGLFEGIGKYKDAMSDLEGYFVNNQFISTDTSILDNLTKVNVSNEDPNSLYINDGNENTHLFYYKMVPDSPVIGVLVIIPSGGETVENVIAQISLHKAAVEKGFLVLFPSINWGTNDRSSEISFLDSMFEDVIKEHRAPANKFILCGLSNGGMVSLSYGINAVKNSNTRITPIGIIGLDPPLDFAHSYHYCEREIERNFTPAGVAEAKWMLNNFQSNYGDPDDNPQNYIDASIFSYGAEDGGNAKYLNAIAIRMLSDLNIDYLINQRKRDLYDWNGTDIVAFVNQLKINGNKNAEVIITQNKGFRPDGRKHPHSWTIMDTNETIEWILDLVK